MWKRFQWNQCYCCFPGIYIRIINNTSSTAAFCFVSSWVGGGATTAALTVDTPVDESTPTTVEGRCQTFGKVSGLTAKSRCSYATSVTASNTSMKFAMIWFLDTDRVRVSFFRSSL